MADLAGTKIADTYDSLLKFNDNGTVETDTVQVISDGRGTATSLSLSTQRATVTLGGGAGDDFIVDGTTLVVEGDNNRVGIGTASPAYSLHVAGGDIVLFDAGGTPKVMCGDDDSNFIEMSYHSANNTGQLISKRSDAYSDLVINPSGGNVGIGDSTPDQALDVNGMVQHGGTMCRLDGSSDDHRLFNAAGNTVNVIKSGINNVDGAGAACTSKGVCLDYYYYKSLPGTTTITPAQLFMKSTVSSGWSVVWVEIWGHFNEAQYHQIWALKNTGGTPGAVQYVAEGNSAADIATSGTTWEFRNLTDSGTGNLSQDDVGRWTWTVENAGVTAYVFSGWIRVKIPRGNGNFDYGFQLA